MKKQFIIQEADKRKRKKFYEYVVNNYNLFVEFNKDYMINSNFPFVIDFKKKNFWVCESIICCACAAQNNQIISIDEFKERV